MEPEADEPASASAATPRSATRRWVIFASFDASGRSSESAVEQVRSYRNAGFEVLVVDTSAELSAERRADWTAEATRWFQRTNAGYDFGSFKAGLLHLIAHADVRPDDLDLLIANDSCFGPFIPLAPIIERFDSRFWGERRVFGITDSVWDVHHIQSYWIYFRSEVAPLAVEFFLEKMAEVSNRAEAIAWGEIELGRFLSSRGCVLEVTCPVRATVARLANFNGWLPSTLEFGWRRLFKRWKYNRDADSQCLRYLLHFPDRLRDFNPIVLFGTQLHRTRAAPFVKKSMFRENVYHDPAIPPTLDVADLTNEDVRALLR